MIWLRITLGCAVAIAAWWLFARAARATRSRRVAPRSVAMMDWLRGSAAVAVLVGHARGLFMQDYEAVRSPSVWWKAFYLVTGLGHQAVIVFFILSGFLVGSTVLARSAGERWDFRDYLTRRLARLYVVLIPGLLLTAAWDGLGLHLFGADGLYGGHLAARHLSMPDVRVTLSLTHFFGNLAFLQHLFIAPFGSNGPLWSLSYELWAYLLFPLVVRAGVTAVGSRRRVIYLVLSAAILSIGGLKLDLYFGVWLMGAGVAAWFRRRTLPSSRPVWARVAAWLAFGGAVLLGRSSKISDWYADPILGIATAALLAVTLESEHASAPAAAMSDRAAAWLAGFSYTLYVAHYPVLTFLFAAFLHRDRWAPTVASAAMVGVIGVAIMLLYAYPLSKVTEARTERVRARLSRVPLALH